MDRQTLRDWFHRFNAGGPEGLIDNWTEGPKPRLSAAQLAEFATIVEAGPDREKDGVVRWRRVDLKRVIFERFGVEFHERYVGKLQLVTPSTRLKYKDGVVEVPNRPGIGIELDQELKGISDCRLRIRFCDSAIAYQSEFRSD